MKSIIQELEGISFPHEAYFAFKRVDQLDEFVQANEQGLIDFAKSILTALMEKEGQYSALDYDVMAIGSDMKPTYVEFKRRESPKVKAKKPAGFDIRNPLTFGLYILGMGVSLACLLTGAYTIIQYLMK
ncbi:MAG: hypothetical protein AAF600_22005 [Bacteroidota bacterium]